jgi:hypothetical protein
MTDWLAVVVIVAGLIWMNFPLSMTMALLTSFPSTAS